MKTAKARATSNIAFIKYWGNRDDALRLPSNPSISMNLAGLHTDTEVRWRDDLTSDILILNGKDVQGNPLARVVEHLDALRRRFDIHGYAEVYSKNNFPTGAGIASSASAFAALTLAAVSAAGQTPSERELTTLARLGSGSASRSIPAGYVEWYTGDTHEESFAESVAPVEHWALCDVIAIVSDEHKAVVSRAGHISASTSDLQSARVAGAMDRFNICHQAIMERDFDMLAEVVEHDSNLMHAVMMTSRPPLFYWLPTSLIVMERVRQLRGDGLSVCYTLDAGPNVHCICTEDHALQVADAVRAIDGVIDVRVAKPGQGAILIGDA